MPFVQMENISHFLRACQAPPLNLQQHDMFLTVDLYEQKDPAQVLQCLAAFSRSAHEINPSRFPAPIGPKSRATGAGVPASPQTTGSGAPFGGARGRGISINSNSSSAYGSNKPVLPPRSGDMTPSGRSSPTKSPVAGSGSPGTVSSWSKREHEGATSPAWNIAQYGYMGGASQGNLGISFGGVRQITSAGPSVPSLAEKEKRRKEEEERQAEEDQQRRAQQEAEEEEARRQEELRWERETQRLREEERRKVDDEKRKWEEQERQWKLAEESRRQEEKEAEAHLERERQQAKRSSDARLRGQFLSQYQAEQAQTNRDAQSERVAQLERELEKARQREAEYERERQGRPGRSRPASEISPTKARSRSRPRGGSPTPSAPSAVGPQREKNRFESWTEDEREYLQTKHLEYQRQQQDVPQQSIEEDPRSRESTLESMPESEQDQEEPAPMASPRPLPDPNTTPKAARSPNPGAGRPLPQPSAYASPPSWQQRPSERQQYQQPQHQNRADRFLAGNEAPSQPSPRQTYSRELGATEEQDGEDRRRAQSQAQTKAGGWASKSLLEREMEMERQRQREWEDSQRETARAARPADGAVDGVGGGVGGRWDVGQWSGYTGGDGQNRGNQGIGAGRRQIVGPRPLPGSNR